MLELITASTVSLFERASQLPPNARRRCAALAALVGVLSCVAAACDDSSESPPPAKPLDASLPDAPSTDATATDSGALDAAPEASPADSGTEASADASASDAATDSGSDSGDAGAPFGAKTSCATPTKVSDNTSPMLVGNLALQGNGERAMLAYLDLQNTTRTQRVRPFDGATWGAIATLNQNSDYARPGRFSVGPGGAAVLAYPMGIGVGARYRFDPIGGTWGSAASWDEVPDATEASAFAFINATQVLGAWYGLGAPVFSVHAGAGWGASAPVSSDTSNVVKLLATQTTTGLAVAWSTLDEKIRVRFVDAGGALAGEAVIDQSVATALISFVTLSPLPGGKVLLAWYRTSAGPVRELMVSTVEPTATTPTVSTPMAVATGEEFNGLNAVTDADGDVTLGWFDSGALHAIRRVGGAWGSVADLGKSYTDTPLLAADAAGHVTALVGEILQSVGHRRVAKGSHAWSSAHRVDTAATLPQAIPTMTVVKGNPVFAWVANTPSPVVVATVCQ